MAVHRYSQERGHCGHDGGENDQYGAFWKSISEPKESLRSEKAEVAECGYKFARVRTIGISSTFHPKLRSASESLVKAKKRYPIESLEFEKYYYNYTVKICTPKLN